MIEASELILNDDGSIYHLRLHPGDLARDIITVGDPKRVDRVAQHLDQVFLEKQNREFKSVTGEIGGRLVSIVATGIGTDNIDIVFNEIDALFNIDFASRRPKQDLRSLRFYRLGTSGSLTEDIPIGAVVLSKYAVGLDGLLYFYKDYEKVNHVGLVSMFQESSVLKPYAVAGSERLLRAYSSLGRSAITITAPGFYAPQGRKIRLDHRMQWIFDRHNMHFEGVPMANFEMETAGIYSLSSLLSHEAVSFNCILANRVSGDFAEDPNPYVEKMITSFLDVFLNH